MSENWYERHVLPYVIHFACGTAPIRKQRLKVIPQAHGRVLEVGLGTGLNLPFYDKRRVRSIVGVDPALRMHRLALRRVQACGIDVELVGLSAEKLPLEDASFDTVVSTYTLCTIADWERALEQMRRVLKPGGQLLFSEHGEAPDERVRAWQHRVDPVWTRLAGGCHITRPIPRMIEAAGFVFVDVESTYLPGPKIAFTPAPFRKS